MITLCEPARYYFHHCPGQQQQDIGAGPAQGKGADSDSGDRSEKESTQKAASPQYTAGQARHGPGMQTEGQLQDCEAFPHVGSGCLICKD